MLYADFLNNMLDSNTKCLNQKIFRPVEAAIPIKRSASIRSGEEAPYRKGSIAISWLALLRQNKSFVASFAELNVKP